MRALSIEICCMRFLKGYISLSLLYITRFESFCYVHWHRRATIEKFILCYKDGFKRKHFISKEIKTMSYRYNAIFHAFKHYFRPTYYNNSSAIFYQATKEDVIV